MDPSVSCAIKSTFKGFCLVFAIIMVFYWWFELIVEDEDYSLVDYKKFQYQVTDTRLPEISLCIENPFISENLEDINSTFSVENYIQFLKGEIYDEQMKDIDYDNVTVNLADYYLYSTVGWNNGSFLTYTSQNETVNKGTYVSYNGFLHNKFVKCFASELDDLHIGLFNWFQILYIQNPFLNGLTGTAGRGLVVVHHYPRQFLVSLNNVKFFSKTQDKSNIDSSFIMSLYLKDMEILNRRNKRGGTCLRESNRYDEIMYEKHFSNIGCRAPYQKSNENFPICDTKEKMRKTISLSSEIGSQNVPPCQTMSRLNFDYEEFDIPRDQRDYRGPFFGLQYHIPDQYKLIKHSKSITTASAFGYIGGYLALILGTVYIPDQYKLKYFVFNVL